MVAQVETCPERFSELFLKTCDALFYKTGRGIVLYKIVSLKILINFELSIARDCSRSNQIALCACA